MEGFLRSFYLSPESAEGNGGEGLILGQYKTMEEAEKGHKETQGALTKASEDAKAAKEEAARLKAELSNRTTGAGREKAEAAISKAKAELAAFEKDTDFTVLSGLEHADALDKRRELKEAVKTAEKGLTNLDSEGSQKAIEAKIYADLGAYDKSLLAKVEGITPDRISEVEKFADKHKTLTLMEAYYRMTSEATAKELKDLKAKYDANLQPDAERKKDERKPPPRVLTLRETLANASKDTKLDKQFDEMQKALRGGK